MNEGAAPYSIPPIPDPCGAEVCIRNTICGRVGIVTALPGSGVISDDCKRELETLPALRIIVRAWPRADGRAPQPSEFEPDTLAWAISVSQRVSFSRAGDVGTEIIADWNAFCFRRVLDFEAPLSDLNTWAEFAWQSHWRRVGYACRPETVPVWPFPEYLSAA